MAAPTGAPRPLVKSIQAESKGAAHCWAAMPLATTAFIRRAPSMCVLSPRRRATSATARIFASGHTEPPQEAAARHVTVVRTNGRLDGREVELTTRAVEPLHVDAGQRGRPARLEVDGMRGAMRNHLLAVTAVHAHGDLVAHGARGQKERRVLAQELGDHVLQEIDRRILVLLLVAHLRLAHEAAHLGGGLGYRVAVKVDLDRHRCSPIASVRRPTA